MVIAISSALQSLSHVTRGQGIINSHIIRMRVCHHHPGVGYIAYADARKKHTYTFSKCNTCMLVGGPRIYHDMGRCSHAGLSLASLLIIMLRTHPHCTLGGKRNLPRAPCLRYAHARANMIHVDYPSAAVSQLTVTPRRTRVRVAQGDNALLFG